MVDMEEQILRHLDGYGGYTTGQIADFVRPVVAGNKRVHSAWVRQKLLEMQRAGKVAPMDNQKPVCWVATHGKEGA